MNYKNIDLAELPFYNVSEDAAKSFIDWRASLKKPLTQRAFNMCLKEAVLCGQLGLSPDEALDKTQIWGWQAPNYAYTMNKIQNEFNALAVVSTQGSIKQIKNDSTLTKNTTLLDDLGDRGWAQ